MEYPTYVLAADIGGTKIASAIIYYAKEGVTPTILNLETIATKASLGGAVVLDRLSSICAKQIQYAASNNINVVGIGIDTAGCVDATSGSILYANEIMPGWTGQKIAERLESDYKLPVAVMGDVHGHAQGEARWGAAKGLHSALVVAAGTGIGGAYVLEGKVVRGAHGASCHLGHSLTPASNFKCTCGKSRHIESVASGTGIGALYQNKSFMDSDYNPEIDGGYVSKKAYEGEQKAIYTLYKAGYALGESIGSWTNLFDPSAIILSGSVLLAGDKWKEGLLDGFKSQVMPLLEDTPIKDAKLEGDTAIIGAAENLLDKIEL